MIFKRIYRHLFPKVYTLKELSNLTIESLRACGAKVGENVDIISSSIDTLGGVLLSIGNNVTITGSRILTHDASTYKCLGYTKLGEVTIGNDVFIGIGTIILPNTHIGNKVIVGAGTIVAHDIPDNSVVTGNPFRILCTYDDYMEKQKGRMQSLPCLDILPEDLLKEESQVLRAQLETAKCGFIK